MKGRSRSSSIRTRRSSGRGVQEAAEPWTKAGVLRELEKLANPRVHAKLAYFGVHVPKALGISAPMLHRFARRIGKNHKLAEQLWSSGIHEARILAALIGEPAKVTAAQMEHWARGFDAWDVVDSACCYLYAYAAPAWSKAYARSRRREEFVKRAVFSLMAYLSYKDKAAVEAHFERCLPIIEREAGDGRNFVKKAVNWALRNIGKRSLRLNRAAIETAKRISKQDSSSARWIAADALRELQSEAVQRRLRAKTVRRKRDAGET